MLPNESWGHQEMHCSRDDCSRHTSLAKLTNGIGFVNVKLKEPAEVT